MYHTLSNDCDYIVLALRLSSCSAYFKPIQFHIRNYRMASSKFDDIWRLMSQYTVVVDPESINEDLTCLICKKLMIDACQSVCGCQYCHKCIVNYLSVQDRHCPGGKSECEEDYLVMERDVFRNTRMNNKIYKVRVLCPNEQCQSKMELHLAESHLSVCPKQPTPCPFESIGCDNSMVSQDSMVTHFYNDSFTHSHMLMECIRNLRNEVDELKNAFVASKLEMASLREESRIKDVQIGELVIQMEVGKRELMDRLEEQKQEIMVQMEEQYEEFIDHIEGQSTDIKEQKKEMECVMKEVRDKETGMRTLMEKFLAVRDETELRLSAIKVEMSDMEVSVQKLRIDDTKTEITDERRKNDKDTTRKMNNLVLFFPNIDVDFVWRIDKLTEKRNTMLWKYIYTDPFFSNSYKLCLSILITVDDINLYCIIMKGDNDDGVQWPMRQHVTLGLLNQDTLRTHKSVTIHCDNYKYSKSAFTRPVEKMNENYMIAYSFIKYSSIRDNTSIVADDSVIVTCVLSDDH